MAAPTTTTTSQTQTPTGVLALVRADQALLARAEVTKLHHVLEWAVAHEVMTLDDAMFLAGYGEHGLTLAGPGAPLIAESAVVELAAALGVSTDTGARYVGDALEIRYRLPQLWERVATGACPVWRARRVAQVTAVLCEEGAAFVDDQVAAFAHTVSYAQLERLVDVALQRWEPEVAEAKRKAAAEHRHVTIRDHDPASGTASVEGCLDLADARDLDTALSNRAKELGELGCPESLAVRRSLALGDLARSQDTLAYGQGAGASEKPRPPARRTVRLNVHLAHAAVSGEGYDPAQHGIARLDGGIRTVLAAQVRAWCQTAGTVIVRPVLDLNASIHVESYETTQTQRDQAAERDRTCVFPWCTRPAENCDNDHREAYDQGGETETENLAPLCRRHHRMKTHHGWTYDSPAPAAYVWRSPAGLRYLRCHTGTLSMNDTPPRPPP